MFLISAAFSASRPKEFIVAVGFLELAQLLEKRPPRVIWVPTPHRFDYLVKRLFKLIASFRPTLMGPESATFEPAEYRLLGTRARLVLFEYGLCQFGSAQPAGFLAALADRRREKLSAETRAMSALSKIGLQEGNYGFIHLRFGDYDQFRVKGKSPVVPADWYLLAIDEIRNSIPELPLVVLSDDLSKAKSWLGETIHDLHFIELATSESFHLMVKARAGILSASTFSWWGARLASERSEGPFIAPEYWMGFRSGIWFPSDLIESSFLVYRSVT